MRLAVEGDAPEIMRMGRAFAEVAGFKADDYSMLVTIRMLLDTGGLFVIGDPPHGMVGAILYPHYFDRSATVAQEMFWWVDKEHRKSGAGMVLLEGLEKWAKDNQAKSLTMIALAASDGDSMGRFYESRGYVPLERHYVKVL